jgi:hypothetical protein
LLVPQSSTSNRMNTVVSQFTAFRQDAELADNREGFQTGVNPVTLDELIHEIRQPLGVIESLTYFIELTTTDEKIGPRLDHIQSMLAKVHHMLEDASERGVSEWPAQMRTECS